MADEIGQLAEQMRRHVQHELVMTRLRGEDAAPLPLRPVVERLAASLRRTPGGERLQWQVAIPEGLTVAMDAQDITELLGNLLDNAVKWARTSICIEAQQGEAGAVIRVLDDGAGVPDSALASLAGRGVRLDEGKPGHGLGLAIARDIAAACGGALSVSNRDGGGFVVHIVLPLQQRNMAHA